MTSGLRSRIELPEQFTSAYTEDDKAAVAKLHEFLFDEENQGEGWTQAQLSKRSSVNAGTLNTVLQGKYPSPPTRHLRACLEVIELARARKERPATTMRHVETSVNRAVVACCKRARMYRNFSVLSAFVGTGKTRCLYQYAGDHSNVHVLEALPGLSTHVMLSQLVKMTSANVIKSRGSQGGTRDQMFDAVVNAVKGTDSLFIIDEAETLTESSLEYIRRLRDLAGIGIVLAGTERLFPLVRDPRGRFGQISSRVGFWPPIIKSITRDDAEALARAAFEPDGVQEQLTDETLDALWQVCDGSARVLCEAIVPGVRDYGLRKGKALTKELIFKVGNDVLGFGTRRV